jgi:hypothetical protein
MAAQIPNGEPAEMLALQRNLRRCWKILVKAVNEGGALSFDKQKITCVVEL